MAGSIVVELIFTIPGMGLLTFDAILNRDYPVINAVLFFSALLTLLGILLVDLSYALADPRIRYE
jgi:peptide/nickel transport system permease protein